MRPDMFSGLMGSRQTKPLLELAVFSWVLFFWSWDSNEIPTLSSRAQEREGKGHMTIPFWKGEADWLLLPVRLLSCHEFKVIVDHYVHVNRILGLSYLCTCFCVIKKKS